MKIGVLALQGDFREHRISLEKLGADVTEVRLPEQLEGLQGLIIPGGESTTIGKLMVAYGLLEPSAHLWANPGYLGNLRRRNPAGQRSRARATPAQLDEYGNQAQCFWAAD